MKLAIGRWRNVVKDFEFRRASAYRVGEHSRLVLSGLLGYDADRIDSLIAGGAVEAP